MIEELKYITFDTDIGWIGILSSTKGLRRATLPQDSAQRARQLLRAEYAVRSTCLFADLVNRFRAYCSGEKTTFPDRLDLSGATVFQRRVWEMTRLIPHGNTGSYLWVAMNIGKPGAVRAVGQALAGNPLPIIVPCHRVLTSNGKVGGFSGGVGMKRRLLDLEAAAGMKKSFT